MLEKGRAALHCSTHMRREGKGERGEATHGSAWQGEETQRRSMSPCRIHRRRTLREDATRPDPVGEQTDPTMEALEPILEAPNRPSKEWRQGQTDARFWCRRAKERRRKGETAPSGRGTLAPVAPLRCPAPQRWGRGSASPPVGTLALAPPCRGEGRSSLATAPGGLPRP
jgi:hypothetical protein